MSQIKLRPYPALDVFVHPAAAHDARTRRVIEKELRAAGWGGKGAHWVSGAHAVTGLGPSIYLSCQDDVAAVALAVSLRIGLAHFVAGVRSRLPEWTVRLNVHGNDGVLRLKWGLDVTLEDAARSLLGRVPSHREDESEGRRFWGERDGGISLLSLGSWEWDPTTHGWQKRDE